MTKNKKILLVPFILILLGSASCFKEDSGIIQDFYSYPNPYHPATDGNATFKMVFNTADITEYRWTLNIYTENGNLLYTAQNTVSAIASPLLISWPGRDNSGNVAANGVYTSIIKIEVTKDTSGYAAGTYQERCYTVIN